MAVETAEYLAGLRRFIRAAGRRVADADEVELVMLIDLHRELDEAIQVGVNGQRASGSTWDVIGAATGVTKQAAFQKWGPKKEEVTR